MPSAHARGHSSQSRLEESPAASRLARVPGTFADWHDQLMLSGTCAYCGNQTHFTARTGRVSEVISSRDTFNRTVRLEIAATCDACHRFNTAVGTKELLEGNGRHQGLILDGPRAISEGEAMTIESWAPPAMRPVDVSFIPEGVAGFFKEAHDAFSIGAHRAVLLLVRSVIEATAKDKHITSGSLVQKINNLASEGLIRTGTKEMAHALRILGNDMAHGDIDQVPSAEDADDALTIARFVLDDVYVADARRADMMARRSGAGEN